LPARSAHRFAGLPGGFPVFRFSAQ
jgi:hypothetical protein